MSVCRKFIFTIRASGCIVLHCAGTLPLRLRFNDEIQNVYILSVCLQFSFDALYSLLWMFPWKTILSFLIWISHCMSRIHWLARVKSIFNVQHIQSRSNGNNIRFHFVAQLYYSEYLPHAPWDWFLEIGNSISKVIIRETLPKTKTYFKIINTLYGLN